MTEIPEANQGNKKKYAPIFFEQLNLSFQQTVPDCVLALYAQGKITGTVVNVGGSLTNVLSIYDGYAVKKSFRSNQLGGMHLTLELLKKLKDAQTCRDKNQDYFDAEKIKIEKCFYSIEGDTNIDKIETCELPDGNKIDLKRGEQQEITDMLFKDDNTRETRSLIDQISRFYLLQYEYILIFI